MKATRYLGNTTAIIRSWLRDVLMAVSGAPQLVINTDVQCSIDVAAAATDASRVARALRAVDETDASFTYNVSPETCLDVLLFDIREAIYGTCSIS